MKNRETQPGNLEGYMTLTFLGFYDKKGNYCVFSKCPCCCVNDYFVNAGHSVRFHEECINKFICIFFSIFKWIHIKNQ
jgi:hypothetical protein